MPLVISFITILCLVALITYFANRHFRNSLDLSEAYNLFYQGKYQQALAITEEKLTKFPDRQEIYLSRASIYSELKNYNEAIKNISKAIELNPQNASAYRIRSELYRFTKKNELAVIDAEKAIQLKPNDALSYILRALALVASEEYSESLKDTEYVIRKLRSEDFISYLTRGLAHAGLKEYENTIYDFDKAYAYADNDDRRYILLNERYQVFTQIKEYPEALADANEMIEIKANSESYTARGRIYRLMSENERSLADYQKVYELNPEDTNAQLSVAVNYDILGEQSKAAAILEELIQGQKIADLAYNYRAWMKAYSGDYTSSLSDAEQAIALNAEVPSFYDTRAQTKWLLGDFSGALADFQEAINRADKALPIYLLGKAAALYKLGREEEALSLWRETKPEAIETLQEEYRFAPPFYQCLLELEKRSVANG